ncbi:MAG: hypothetical protein WAU50_15385 [Candidatus Sulfotelmatobacter sp.]|jgi:hypothetical protein
MFKITQGSFEERLDWIGLDGILPPDELIPLREISAELEIVV